MELTKSTVDSPLISSVLLSQFATHWIKPMFQNLVVSLDMTIEFLAVDLDCHSYNYSLDILRMYRLHLVSGNLADCRFG